MNSLQYSALTVGLTIAAIIFGIALLPDASAYPIPADVSTSISTIFGYVNAWNYFIDIVTFMKVFSIIMVIEMGVFLFNIISLILRLLLKSGNN